MTEKVSNRSRSCMLSLWTSCILWQLYQCQFSPLFFHCKLNLCIFKRPAYLWICYFRAGINQFLLSSHNPCLTILRNIWNTFFLFSYDHVIFVCTSYFIFVSASPVPFSETLFATCLLTRRMLILFVFF